MRVERTFDGGAQVRGAGIVPAAEYVSVRSHEMDGAVARTVEVEQPAVGIVAVASRWVRGRVPRERDQRERHAGVVQMLFKRVERRGVRAVVREAERGETRAGEVGQAAASDADEERGRTISRIGNHGRKEERMKDPKRKGLISDAYQAFISWCRR